MKVCEAHLPCICCKVKSQTASKRSVVLLNQNSASVWNFWWNYTPLLDMISFSRFYFETWLAHFLLMSLHLLIIFFIFIFFQCFWDLHCVPTSFFYTLGPSCVPFFFSLFAQPCYLFLEICQRDHILKHGVFILVVMKNMFQHIPSVGIAIYLWHVCEF